jgi:hypothetical protein
MLEIFRPSKVTSPEVVRKKDDISLKRVDLPAPFGPITDNISFA